MKEDYEYLLTQEKNKKAEKEQYESRNRSINDQIERLEEVKRILKEAKEEYQEENNQLTIYPSNFEGEWIGEVYDEATRVFWDEAQVKSVKIVGLLDDCLDMVCNEITRLENEKNSNGGIISALTRAINSISNDIATYFN